MAIYDQVFAQANGALLSENTEIDTELTSNIAQILTIVKGFAGISPGSLIRTVKFKNAIPVSGPEFDFERFMAFSIPFQLMLTLGASGKRVVMAEAYVIGPSTMSSSIGKATEQDVMIVGKGTPFA
jgi:hypothetical protein